MQNNINSSDYLRNQVLSYLQHLPEVVSIEPCDQDGSFLVEFAADKKESCELVQFPFE